MAYTYLVNTLPATGAVAIYSLIATLITSGWTKESDSDATTYSAVGTQVTSGATGANGLGNTNAWVRLRSPATNGGSVVNQRRELTFQRGVNNRGWRIKYSASAGFVGGSPSATQTPSSTDEVFMAGGGTDASPTFVSLTWMPADGTYQYNVVAGGADENYSFVAWCASIGVSIGCGTSIFLDVMMSGSYPTSDVDPAVMYCSSATLNNAFQEVISATNFPTANATAPALARAWLGATSSAGAAISATNSQNVGILMNCLHGASSWNFKDNLLPAVWGSNNASPPKGIKGISTLFKTGSVARGSGDTLDVLGFKDKIYLGGAGVTLWGPWSGVEPEI